MQQLKDILQKQFGASIDMLKNAIEMCPNDFWNTREQFGYMAFHTIFFLDYYLTLDSKTFNAPAPFRHSEFDTDEEREVRAYTKEEILWYLEYCRTKMHDLCSYQNEGSLYQHWVNQSGTKDYPIVELMLYNMRHVQHHSAQMNLMLRRQIDNAPDWVSREGEKY